MRTLRDTTIERIRELRKARGMTQQGLADRINALALSPLRRTRQDPVRPANRLIDQTTIAKIENGKRELTLIEAFQFAQALDVAPVHLFVPTDTETEPGYAIDIAPNLTASPGEVRAWIRGDAPLWQDARIYFSAVPKHEFKAGNADAFESRAGIVVKTSPDDERQSPPEWQGARADSIKEGN
jgi:transcriptional regulator with XRE-family HTH domain